jgi:ketosteroid isomerase-like protein
MHSHCAFYNTSASSSVEISRMHVNSFVDYLAMEVPMSEQVTVETLKGFLEAFNRHDLDAIMDYFAADCVFYMPRGAQPRGTRFVGKQEVRAGLAKRFEGIPDVHYGDDQHWLCGDFGVSEWTLTGTSTSGQRIEVRGVDLLEFAQGKIIRKDSFWKILE